VICRDFTELATEYLEGALPWRTRRGVKRHLAGCDGCTAYLEQLRLAIRGAAEPPPEPVDPAVREQLLRAFRGEG
jgi:anti-sigma factor RsiW